MKPIFFASRDEFREWLKAYRASEDGLWVGFHKKASGIPSITYPEALDEALCFGWIDGVRKSLDPDRYVIRFTPRRPDSHWSAVNGGRAQALIAAGRMHPAGLKVFESRLHEQKTTYSAERKSARLDPALEKRLRSNIKAWTYFQSRPPSYRQVAIFWIMSAKKEETRLKRFTILSQYSEEERIIPPFGPPPKLRGRHRKPE
jgi:uncharacterized protein YdeI (YjbR/CyaY-like superfamily)